jgi:2-aminoadipate transaminase
MKYASDPECYYFASGAPDHRLFPIDYLCDEIIPRVRHRRGSTVLQYGSPQGHPDILNQLVNLSIKENENASVSNIQITVGSQNGLDAIAATLIDEGDSVVVGRPTYAEAIGLFRSYGADFVEVPVDDDGMDTDFLESRLSQLGEQGRGQMPKCIYVVPDFQNPTGATLSLQRRKHIIELAVKYDTVIVEDSPYKCMRYEGEDLPSLYSLDWANRVIGLRSFSKMAWPGMRFGWIVAPEFARDRLTKNLQPKILTAPSFDPAIVAEYLESGILDAVLERGRRVYQGKLRVMLQALRQHMPPEPGIKWTKPHGGFYVWLTLPNIDTDLHSEFYTVLTEQRKVVYIPGSVCYASNSVNSNMRLSFTLLGEDEIERGVCILGSTVNEFGSSGVVNP